MTTKNEYHQFNDNQLLVLAFLKNIKMYSPDNFDYLIFYGASAREMIKFMEYPEKFGDFDFGFVCSLFRAIDKIFQHYIIECPTIPAQKEEDRILVSFLMNAEDSFLSVYTNDRLFNKGHYISYLSRQDVIYKWNGWMVYRIQHEIKKMKEEMQQRLEIVG